MYDKLNDEEFCSEIEILFKRYFNRKHSINSILEIHFNKSFSSIRQRFKRTKRKPIKKFRDEILLEIVCKKLKKCNCFDVMLSCGFTHPSHFATWFRKKTGINPSEYLNINNQIVLSKYVVNTRS